MSLSVILPNYNHAKYLPQSLEAILKQSYPASEIIILDDASQDESVSLIKSYAKKYPQIKFYQNPKNLGAVLTINAATHYSSGKYLAFCAADDCVLPGFFEKLMGFMKKHPEVALCTSNARFFQNDGTFWDEDWISLGDQERLIEPEELSRILRETEFWLPSHTTIYKREFVLEHGCLLEDLKMASDFYLNYAIALRHPIGYVPEALASFRQGVGSYSTRIFQDKAQREEVFHNLCKKIDESPKEVRERFLRSSLFSRFGKKMFFFLIKNPKYWAHLSPILKYKFFPVLLKKLKNYAKRK